MPSGSRGGVPRDHAGLRAHGESDRPHEAAAYPPDALTRDGMR